MNVTTVLAINAGKKLKGRNWEDKSFIEDACELLLDDLPLSPSAPGGGAAYRHSLCLSFLFKFHLQVKRALTKRNILTEPIPEMLSSAELDIPRGTFKSSQFFEMVPKSQHEWDAVGIYIKIILFLCSFVCFSLFEIIYLCTIYCKDAQFPMLLLKNKLLAKQFTAMIFLHSVTDAF